MSLQTSESLVCAFLSPGVCEKENGVGGEWWRAENISKGKSPEWLLCVADPGLTLRAMPSPIPVPCHFLSESEQSLRWSTLQSEAEGAVSGSG